MRTTLLGFITILLACLPAHSEAIEAPRTVVRIDVSSRAQIDSIARIAEPWDVDLRRGLVTTDVTADQMERLRELGFDLHIDHELTRRYNQPLKPLKTQSSGIPGFPCYRTVTETFETMEALNDQYPDFVELIDIGDSWEKITSGGADGHDLLVLRITDENSAVPSSDKARVWIQSAIHARELVTAETTTRFAEYVLENATSDPNLRWQLRSTEIYLLLHTNPDGRQRAETGLYWRKNTDDTYHGSCESTEVGIDLNRNFDFEWGCCGGSSTNPCDPTYRGPSPASEPETQAVQDYLTANFPDWRPDDFTSPAPDDASGLFLDIHSYGGDIFAPGGFNGITAPNLDQLVELGRKFSYFNNYNAIAGGNYTVDGSTTDWGYGRLGLPSYTFELGTEFFQQCASFEATIYPDNLQALLYALKIAGAPYTLPAGPDMISLMTLPSVVRPGETIYLSAIADDARHGPGQPLPAPSISDIARAEYSIDVAHGPAFGSATPLAAGDGSFDDSREGLEAVLSTSGLANGEHTVFARAQDAEGNWGPPEAAALLVLPENQAAQISGTVTRSTGGAPTGIMISAGPYRNVPNSGGGDFELLLPEGTHTITAQAPGYYSASTEALDLEAGDHVVRDFELERYQSRLQDDVENGNQGWTAEGSWQITQIDSASGDASWSDSPIGEYRDGSDISLVSPPLNFSGISDVSISFKHRYAFETGYDYGYLEYSLDGGQSWRGLRSFTSERIAWINFFMDTPQLDNQPDVRVRFHLVSDGYLTEDGWFIDDIVIAGEGRRQQAPVKPEHVS